MGVVVVLVTGISLLLQLARATAAVSAARDVVVFVFVFYGTNLTRTSAMASTTMYYHPIPTCFGSRNSHSNFRRVASACLQGCNNRTEYLLPRTTDPVVLWNGMDIFASRKKNDIHVFRVEQEHLRDTKRPCLDHANCMNHDMI